MMTSVETAEPALAPQVDSGPKAGRSSWGVLAWMVLACVLLGTSAGVRAWQDRRFEQEKGYLEDCPFPLADIPKTLGGWRLIDGGERALDDKTIRITGSTQHIHRFYVDELTGVTMGVLVLFGPAEPVLPHTPQACYPANGYSQVEEVADKTVTAEDGKSYQFRTAVYGKSGGRAMVLSEVYHSYRLEGSWSPNSGAGRKFPRKNPGIFKVQVHRVVAPGERRDRDNPIEQFLSVLIPEIERRIADSQAKIDKGEAPSPSIVPPAKPHA